MKLSAMIKKLSREKSTLETSTTAFPRHTHRDRARMGSHSQRERDLGAKLWRNPRGELALRPEASIR